MSDHIYRKIEITGSSTESSDQAVRSAVAKAGETIKHMEWFEVIDMRGVLKKHDVVAWQVTIKIGFRIEE